MTEPSKGYHGVRFYETFGDSGFTMRARMETLPVRMDRHCTNALAVARFLQSHPRVAWVNYPGMPEHPQHALVAKQMRTVGGAPGASGLLAFGVRGGYAAGIRFIEAAQ